MPGPPRSARTGSRTFLRWKLDDSELLYGATADLIDLLTEVEAEALTNPDALPPNGNRSVVFFRLLAGIWSGLLAVLGGDNYDTTGIYRVMEAGTADDSLMMTEGTGVAGLCGHPDGQDPGIHDRRLEWEQYKPQQHPLCSRNLSAAWYDQ